MRHRFLAKAAAAAAVAIIVGMVLVWRATSPSVQTTVPRDHSGDIPATSTSPAPPTRPDKEELLTGFPRTPDGAVAAATAYSLALDRPEVFDPTYRADLLDRIAAADAVDQLESTFTDGLAFISEHLGVDDESSAEPGFVWRAVPGGWQLRDYAPSTATVAIWTAAIAMSDNRLLVEPGWNTTEILLRWEQGGWRLVAFDTQPGPNPMLVTGSNDQVGEQINAFAPFRHWPDELDRQGLP